MGGGASPQNRLLIDRTSGGRFFERYPDCNPHLPSIVFKTNPNDGASSRALAVALAQLVINLAHAEVLGAKGPRFIPPRARLRVCIEGYLL